MNKKNNSLNNNKLNNRLNNNSNNNLNNKLNNNSNNSLNNKLNNNSNNRLNNSLNNNSNNSLNNNSNNSLNNNSNNSLNNNKVSNNINNSNIVNNSISNTPVPNSKPSGTFIIATIFLVIIILLFIIIVPTYIMNNTKENFDNSQNYNSTIFQSGVGGIAPSGNITFNTQYHSTPQVFTQIIGNANISINVYSIIVFNVTNTGFSYIKNVSLNQMGESNTGNSYNITRLQNDGTLQFNWIAIGN